MSDLSRRAFLTRGSLAVAAGGVVAAVPGLGAFLATESVKAPEADTALSDAEAGAAEASTPLVAQLSDVRSGEIIFYQGEGQVVLKDPSLAARMYRANAQGR